MRTESFQFFGMNRSKRANDPYIRVEDSNYRSGTENAGFHQTLRGTILDKYSCFRIASMPPLLPLSHFIGTGYVKNLLALSPTANANVSGMRQPFLHPAGRESFENFIYGSFACEFDDYTGITYLSRGSFQPIVI